MTDFVGTEPGIQPGDRPGRVLHRARMVVDAVGVSTSPGVLLKDRDGVVAAGSPTSVGAVAGAEVVEHPGAVFMPGLVNAHAHLDLTHLGVKRYDGDFPAWLALVRSGRHTDDQAIVASVGLGAEMARRGGTALVGDIAGAGRIAATEGLRRSPLAGVSYLEVFGSGPAAIERAAGLIREAGPGRAAGERGVVTGVQPHAPYSAGIDLYRFLAGTGLPLATHLAETVDERQFLVNGDGPLAEMLKSFGAPLPERPAGAHPVDALSDVLSGSPVVAAHLNDIDDRHIAALASWPITVAYCPRASRYFGHPKDGETPHRYQAMIAAGINVALGTDALICLDTAQRISVLDEMRLLYQRDGTEPGTLLQMATVNGARALGRDPAAFSLSPAGRAGVIAVQAEAGDENPLAAALRSTGRPEWIVPASLS